MIRIFLVITIGFIILISWIKVSGFAEAGEWEKFCLIYMQWVNQYPENLGAGCCEINHPSNDILKEEYLGEPLLFCGGQYIYE